MPKTERQKQNRELSRIRNKRYINQYKEMHQCGRCGEGRTACLDLHHEDPTTKEFEFNKGEGRSIKAINAELKKCIVVCANCHRLIHAEMEFERRKNEPEEETLFSGKG